MKRFVVWLQLENGEPFLFNTYVARLAKTQDLESWKQDPAAFQTWLMGEVSKRLANVRVVISEAGKGVA